MSIGRRAIAHLGFPLLVVLALAGAWWAMAAGVSPALAVAGGRSILSPQHYVIAGPGAGGKELGRPYNYLVYLAFMGMAHLGHIRGSPGLCPGKACSAVHSGQTNKFSLPETSPEPPLPPNSS